MVVDPFRAAREVADAVLYEGYVLYPYRASALKNQWRWQFGVVGPAASGERASVRTEVLVEPGRQATATVRVRFLQVQRRTLEVANHGQFVPVTRLDVGGTTWMPWDEAVEHEVELPPLVIAPARYSQSLEIDGGEEYEDLVAKDAVAGRAVRRRHPLLGHIEVSADWVGPFVKLCVEVRNTSPWHDPGATRDDVVWRSFVAVHTLAAISDGRFISSLDPPPEAREATATCHNDGTYPVLVGDRVVLSSPIILYDQPAVAPESAGDLYDATEIDEILALRVLTLTDEEKAEARGTDPRAAAIVDRCDTMSPESWSRLHGAVRSSPPMTEEAFDPSSDRVVVGDSYVARGSHVRLRPSRRADAHDIFLAGLTATVTGVFHDVDGSQHVAVTLDDDPAAAELLWRGRYLYFHPDELEVLG
jgi:hypothetical protein